MHCFIKKILNVSEWEMIGKERGYWSYFEEKVLSDYYQSSMWRTMIMSNEWKDWYKEIKERIKRGKFDKKGMFTEKVFDVDECQELGIMSPEHWKEFLKFILRIIK